MIRIFLAEKREKSALHRHPWIFSGAINHIEGIASKAGETALVFDSHGKFLAKAAYNPNSKIALRIWTWDEGEEITQDFFRRKLQTALNLRECLDLQRTTNALRLVFAEADGLPGLIVDRYADWLICQFLTAGAEYHRQSILSALLDLTSLSNIYERSDADVRSLEGLSPTCGVLYGDDAMQPLEIRENGIIYQVDFRSGQKTGFYLDQRVNRQKVSTFAREKRVLDCFCYTGGFTINALAAGATEVTAIDDSGEALSLLQKNLALNGLPAEKVNTIEGNAFQILRTQRDRGQSYDLIILDPPKFAPTSAQVERAARGYKDINLLALKLLSPGGILATFSCSGGVTAEFFQLLIAEAALDAGVTVQVIDRLQQAADHPIALNHPESAYLKGLICRVTP